MTNSESIQADTLILGNNCRRVEEFLSHFAMTVIALSFIAVISSYIYWKFQIERGPTLAYFYVALIVASTSRSLAVFLIIFFLPILPTLHLQLEPILKPAVKYFVAYPGLDGITGFCCGLFLRKVYRKEKINLTSSNIPWPLGLLIFVLTISTILAISRNLWMAGIQFSVSDLFANILKFKLMGNANNYMPIANLIVYSFAILFVVVLIDILKQQDNKDDIVFTPVIYSIILSASWGIYQSQTAYGLSELTRNYRLENFGFGAEGFQPDIHAFAGLMLIGAVGLFYYATKLKKQINQSFIYFVIPLSWIALILSKSRASLVFAVIVVFILMIFYFKNNYKKSKYHYFNIILIIFITASALAISYNWWIAEFISAIRDSERWNFESINLLTRWRLEFHRAALLMFNAFPLMGVGEGNFFRLSKILEFSQSTWMTNNGGNNAHNYFLQVLAETGLIGFISYALIFIWPIYHVKNTKLIAPAGLAICSIFLGNIYSHSLLIRENLFLLAVFVALMYSYAANEFKNQTSIILRSFVSTRLGLIVAISICIILLIGTYKEVSNSFYEYPFQKASKLFINSTSNSTGQGA